MHCLVYVLCLPVLVIHSLIHATHTPTAFFPISDAHVTRGGGTHWTLLVCDTTRGKFYYIDSSGTMNYRPAMQLAQKLAPYCLDKYSGKGEGKSKKAKYSGLSRSLDEADFVIVNSPQQENAYDCGIYSTFMANYIAERFVHGASLFDDEFYTSLHADMTPQAITAYRGTMAEHVDEAMKMPHKK